ncbi:MAG: formylmethanofuran dehydrogenase subunit C, partial [Pseudomonadota bacterium]
PSRLKGLSPGDVQRINLSKGHHTINLGDVFDIAGTAEDGDIVFEGGSARFDNVAVGLDAGSITVEGDVGHYAGHKMTAGRLVIKGNARHHLGSSMQDGLIHVTGNVADRVGAPSPGVRDGMAGGAIIIDGTAGDHCGERQRRGLIIAKGKVGKCAGGRMLGGTIWGLSGFGACLGIQMRRGTILTPTLETPLSTFVDCGPQNLGILTIMSRHYGKLLDSRAPALPTGTVQRFVGDIASIGRGEILVTG